MRPPRDTSTEAQASVTEMLRRMAPAERLAAAVDASESIRTLAEAGIRARHPEFTEQEVGTELLQRFVGVAVPLRTHRSTVEVPHR